MVTTFLQNAAVFLTTEYLECFETKHAGINM